MRYTSRITQITVLPATISTALPQVAAEILRCVMRVDSLPNVKSAATGSKREDHE